MLTFACGRTTHGDVDSGTDAPETLIVDADTDKLIDEGETGNVPSLWSPAHDMPTGRASHASAFVGGWALVAGGTVTNIGTDSVDAYDPEADSWKTTSPLTQPRYLACSTLLPSGTWFMAGGLLGSGYGAYAAGGAEAFDPATMTWNVLPAMNGKRYEHACAALPTGGVLASGGMTQAGPFVQTGSAEVFDPLQGWTSTGSLSSTRVGHTATTLGNGTVLVAGGATEAGVTTASAELYDAKTSSFVPTGSLSEHRAGHVAVLLGNGKLLVVGGGNQQILASAELYDAKTGKWLPAGSMTVPRGLMTATLLASGKVLVTGGYNETLADIASAELYDPATNSWSPAGTMASGRAGHAAVLLPSGKVLVTGGNSTGQQFPVDSAELFDESAL